MFYNLEDEKPIVLVVSEPGLLVSNLAVKFLKTNLLDTEAISLDQNFFLEYKKLAKQKRRIYKIIFIYGFYSASQDVYQRAFDFFNLLNENQNEKIPIILISQISTSLEILENPASGYEEYLGKQQTFLSDFLSNFNESLVFLSQDILINKNEISYPLLLFFSAVKQNYLFDLQTKFYFQDEKSFFDLIKESLIKPHRQAKFIVRGSAISSEKLVKKISYLYEQYFQKKLSIAKLFTDEKKRSIFQDFSTVNNAKSITENLIDQRIREIPNFDKIITSIAPSDSALQKALEMSRLQDSRKPKQAAVKQARIIETNQSVDMLFQARKEPQESLKEESFDSEFATKIENLFSIVRKKEKTTRQQKNIIQGKTIIKKSRKRKILFWLGTIGFSVGFVFLSLSFLFNISKKTLQKRLYESVKNGGNGIENIDKSMFYRVFNFQLNQYLKITSEESLGEALDIRRLGISLSALHGSKIKNQQIGYDLYKKTLEGGVDLKQFYEGLTVATDEKVEVLKTFNSYLMALNLDLYQSEEKTVWQASLNANKTELKDALQFKRFFSSFKNFILQPGRVNILVLIQDSSEIRSTGGFLTEVAVLSFDNGVLVDKQVLDVNDLDSRSYGRKESETEIKDVLGENILYLRDSNWQADFVKSNQEIKWFVEQVMGSKIDLTMALNTKTITEFLGILNGVELPDKFLANASNYMDRREKTASLDYKNIGNEKFTWQFANALLEKATSLDKEQFVALGEVLIKNLDQREVLLQTNNQDLQQTIEANSWSGGKVAVTCPTEFKQENCLLDSIFQVENNVGINKINPYIKETIEHNLGISKDFIRHKRKITFENFSKSDVWPLGTYRNYLKFYLNSQASLEKIELNGQRMENQKIKIVDAGENKEISTLLEIPKQSKVEFAITYLVPNKMSVPFSYVFFDQKQPGIIAKETSYNIVFDEQFKPQLIAPQATYQDKTIHFKNDNLDHFLFAIGFNE